jgi:hypothetical protein
MAHDPATGRLTQVMRDVSAALIPVGDRVVPVAQHRRLLSHMAASATL